MDDQEPVSRNIGSPTRLGELSQPIVGSIRKVQQEPSSTIGQPRMGERRSSVTGMQPSGRGVGATPIAEWVLRVLRPFDLPEATMRCLSISLISRIVVVGQGRAIIGSDGQHERTEIGPFQIRKGMTSAEMRQDLATINGSLQFSDEGEIANHVARLMVRTKMRVQGDGEARLLAETMVMDLRVYPIDAVVWACEHWVEGGKDGRFFPSWAELRELCERRVSGRQRLKKALEFYLQESVA